MEFDLENEEFAYVIAVEKPEVGLAGDFVEKEVPSATWAVFESIGPLPKAMQDIWRRIFSEWFPATGYEHADAPELEVYLPGNISDEDYKCEIWIPIIKK
ncbi:GyrI-like small molecule binding protein [Natranaerovirga pectinivora]|uniref:GyrI-like small molecule binding protein n=1 Tax=Natranaerovirga pectinivora TaxID=682400 RepID=A0A4R3MT44_9FIRM|nr:GyrI-like small molecule binding protein [Natranaerovirga pectinivora]